MNIEEAYNRWSKQYDSNINKTRDLEGKSLRETLFDIEFDNCLEIGCGTGKNTEWLISKGKNVLAIDLSKEMLLVAKNKSVNKNVEFLKVDINEDWNFTTKNFDLIVCSLVLEHIENLERIFKLISEKLNNGGILYIGELHPFKQYSGSKARFETENGEQIVDCYTHNISDFTKNAQKYGLQIELINEYFDHENENEIPRILTLKFKKN